MCIYIFIYIVLYIVLFCRMQLLMLTCPAVGVHIETLCLRTCGQTFGVGFSRSACWLD